MRRCFKIFMLFSSAFLVSSCATSSKMYGASGEEMYDIACPGLAVPMSVCYEKALQHCPQGYFLVERDTGSGTVGAATDSGASYVRGVNKGIIIQCK